jgi:stage V sporulation protein SpoVS
MAVSDNTSSTSEQPTTPGVTSATAEGGQRRIGKLGRRALVGVAAVSVCAAGVALTPTAERIAQQVGQQAIDQAYAAGIAAGRQALLSELADLEGVPIEAAIKVAELTRLAVLYIVRPVASLFATIAGDALGGFVAAISSAQDHLAGINVHITQLDQLKSLLTQWQQGVQQLPIALTQYATTDIDSAENYLKSLQKQIQQQSNSAK